MQDSSDRKAANACERREYDGRNGALPVSLCPGCDRGGRGRGRRSSRRRLADRSAGGSRRPTTESSEGYCRVASAVAFLDQPPLLLVESPSKDQERHHCEGGECDPPIMGKELLHSN